MREKDKSNSKPDKKQNLRFALRDNLKKRKSQARKLGQGAGDAQGFSVKLRSREIPKAKPSGKIDTDKE